MSAELGVQVGDIITGYDGDEVPNSFVLQARMDAKGGKYRTLEIRRRVLGEDHPYTLYSLNHMATLYHAQGQWAKGESFCRETLASHKVPRLWYTTDEYPLTGSGKVQKFVLVEQISKGALQPSTGA